MKIGETIKQTRKKLGFSQEALAEHVGLSVQAVSKWECGLSYPDIMLLPVIADFLKISLDKLLRGVDRAEEVEGNPELDLPDDHTLRIVQCIGRKIISRDEWEKKDGQKIPLTFDETWEKERTDQELHIEIWGSADIGGSVIIAGSVEAGGGINCGNIGNDAEAGGGINCGNIENNAKAGGGINCGNVGNNAEAGGSIHCGNVENNVNAGSSVTCSDVNGNVRCDGEIHCRKIMGDVTGGTVFYDK